MRIKIRQTWAGPGGNWPPGAIVTVDNAVAKQMIDSRQAIQWDEPEPVREKLNIETAAIEIPEAEGYSPKRRRKNASMQ
jgi:hypothetical protein